MGRMAENPNPLMGGKQKKKKRKKRSGQKKGGWKSLVQKGRRSDRGDPWETGKDESQKKKKAGGDVRPKGGDRKNHLPEAQTGRGWEKKEKDQGDQRVT